MCSIEEKTLGVCNQCMDKLLECENKVLGMQNSMGEAIRNCAARVYGCASSFGINGKVMGLTHTDACVNAHRKAVFPVVTP